jgi:hypothetical protein
MHHSFQKIGILIAAGLMMQAAATDAGAQALKAGQCDIAIATFNETILAEGQRTIVVGQGNGLVNSQSRSGPSVTLQGFNTGISAREDGTLGYLYEGNMPRGTPSTTVCVRLVLTDIQMNDARRPEIPQSAYLGGPFNDAVTQSARDGSRPMVIANTVFGSGKARRYGSPMIWFGDLSSSKGVVTTMVPDGTPTAAIVLTNVEYTPEGYRRLAGASNR